MILNHNRSGRTSQKNKATRNTFLHYFQNGFLFGNGYYILQLYGTGNTNKYAVPEYRLNGFSISVPLLLI